MNAQAKTINLLLYDGNLSGVISIEDSSWNSGELYSAPRASVQDLLETDACNKYGVYLLLSNSMVYVGQSSDLAKRLTQHTIGKDWWESAVILTTKDDNLTRSDIDYLEYVLIERAFAIDKLDCDNKKKGNPPKVDKFRRVILDQYLAEALFLMQLIGITVFSGGKNKKPEKSPAATPVTPVFNTMDVASKLSLGKRVKTEAVQYVKDHGVSIGKEVSYAVRQTNKPDFWINPKVDLLAKDWYIVLNDNKSNTLIVLYVPANSIGLKSDGTVGLVARADRPEVIDLSIACDTLIDRRSGVDFKPFVLQRLPY